MGKYMSCKLLYNFCTAVYAGWLDGSIEESTLATNSEKSFLHLE